MTITASGDLVISYYLLKNATLWVWDWDDTLINTDAYMLNVMDPNSIREKSTTDLDRDVPTWRYFKKIIEYLIMHGNYVAIASFGTYEIIQAYMDRILGFNQKMFTKTNIIAPCLQIRRTVNFKLPPNKNEYIYQLMKFYRIEDFSKVVLFDDMAVNVSQAIAIGAIGVQIDSPRNSSTSKDKLFFGPWTMESFDKKIESQCGSDLYLNQKFTGITNKSQPYEGLAFDKMDFGSGVQEKFAPIVAFGTAIGSRKFSKKPEYQWNPMNVGSAPIYWGGNYFSDPEDSLCMQDIGILDCGSPKMQDQTTVSNLVDFKTVKNCSNINNKTGMQKNANQNNCSKIGEKLVKGELTNEDKDRNGYGYDNGNDNGYGNDYNNNNMEGFKSFRSSCSTCSITGKYGKLSWLFLLLLVIMGAMALIIFR